MSARRHVSLLDRIRRGIRAFTLGDEPPGWFLKTIGAPDGGESASGAVVTELSALRVAAVLSCVRVLAESISTLPLGVFERKENGDRERVPDHPIDWLLHSMPNEEGTAQAVRETMATHVLLRGNAYTRIVRDGGGDVRELWNLDPRHIQPDRLRRTKELIFDYSAPGEPKETLRPDQLWRVPGLSWNGVTGLTPIALARESIGVSMQLERSTAKTVKNSARIPIVVMHPGEMDEEEYQRFKQSWKEQFAGPEMAGGTPILEGGAKVEKIGMTLDDMEFLELKKFQIREIARVYRVPLHMLYDDAQQPRANMEQASLEFVVYSLRAWLVRFEQTITRDLLLPAERRRFFAEHNVAGLLRGDFATRMAGYAMGRQWGWWSVNDVLRLENQNGIGPQGDIYLQPSNMAPAGESTDPAKALEAERARRAKEE